MRVAVSDVIFALISLFRKALITGKSQEVDWLGCIDSSSVCSIATKLLSLAYENVSLLFLHAQRFSFSRLCADLRSIYTFSRFVRSPYPSKAVWWYLGARWWRLLRLIVSREERFAEGNLGCWWGSSECISISIVRKSQHYFIIRLSRFSISRSPAACVHDYLARWSFAMFTKRRWYRHECASQHSRTKYKNVE